MIEAWWFENKQKSSEILQPEWFNPKTHCGIYAEFNKIEFPIILNLITYRNNKQCFCKEIEIKGLRNSADYEIMTKNNTALIKVFAKGIEGLPEYIYISFKLTTRTYHKKIKCKYSTLQGYTKDFDGHPFPTAVVFERKAFGGKTPYIGVWSDNEGKYSVTVPNGEYNAFYVENNTYKTTTLENWSWKMYVDRNETHDFKIGTGEVYGLSVWQNTGGGEIMFLYFRPMILPQIKMRKYTVKLNNENREVIDIQPDLKKENIKIFIDGREVQIFSLQKLFETGNYKKDKFIMISYIVQIKAPPLTRGKHTVILEYETNNKYKSQSQGRTQFFINSTL